MNRIAKLFKQHEVNVLTIARECKVSPQAVYNWLDGTNKPSADSLIRLCEYLDVEATEIVDLAE
jgi:transcriptional regulator with XRE-family HTH domain